MHEAVGHGNFKILFDTSHAYMVSVIGSRQIGDKEVVPGGLVEFTKSLEGRIGHLHLIDSDGTLHNEETSTHTPFGEGNINLLELLRSIRSEAGKMEWWCVDFCFCPTTERDAKAAVPFLRKTAHQLHQLNES
jgi:sugar phosphate isomerase/epimerase